MARAMRDSGIEWIGEVPETWNLSRLQWCLEEIKEKNDPIRTTNVLSLTNKLGVVPYEEKGNQGNKAKEDYTQYGLAFENTLVINSMNVLIGSVGISKYYGCVSPVYYVYKTTDKSDLRFINYLFQNVGFQKELRKYANGILEIRLRISSHDMLRRIIPLPQKDEQIRIADFLDTECARIDAVMEQTRASIEEYKKLKQAIITEAVTKGIRPNRPMKYSGIDWIRCVPSSWEVRPIKNSFTIVSGATPKSDNPNYWDGNIAWITPADYKFDDKYITAGKRNLTIAGYDSCGTTMVPKGSIVFSKRAPIGTVAIAGEQLCTNQGCLSCVPKQDVCSEYFYYTVAAFEEQYNLYGTGTTFKEISFTAFSDFKLPLPPYEEQVEIAEWLDQECYRIDTLIDKKKLLLAIIESYKKSLIFEYVTGKKEVDVNA